MVGTVKTQRVCDYVTIQVTHKKKEEEEEERNEDTDYTVKQIIWLT